VLQWGEANAKGGSKDPSELKATIKEVLPYIRFPLLKISELAAKVVPRNVLESEQTLELFAYVAQRDSGGFPKLGSKISSFNATKRKILEWAWDLSTPMENIVAEEEGKVLHSLPFKGGNTSCRALPGWTSGRHTWRITLLAITSNTSFRNGVMTEAFISWQRSGFAIGNDSDQTAMGFYSGTFCAGGFPYSSQAVPSFSTGTVLYHCLDLDRRQYFVGTSKETLNLISDNLPTGHTYYPAITFYDSSSPTRIRIDVVDH